MKKINLVGVDVSSKELVVKIERANNGTLQSGCFKNDTAGQKKLLKFITRRGQSARVCMEATGIYHMGLALLLHRNPRVEVMVMNPKVIKHLGIAMMQRAKTDPVDAGIILEYLKRMEFRAWQAPTARELELQMLSRRLQQLKGEKTREVSRRHASGYHQTTTTTIERDIEVNINHLDRRIERLEATTVALIKTLPAINDKFNLLISIKGIAQTSAIHILAELIGLPEDLSARQWVAYAGLDPRPVESGERKAPRKISKAGNQYLRIALYMPAWVAVQKEPTVAAFYQHSVNNGKEKMQAIIAVMRKLLHAIWGMLRSNTPWDATKFYQSAHPVSEG